MTRVYIKTLGCKVNRVDSDGLTLAIQEAGGECVQNPDDAQLAIINTCTVTAEADRKVRKELRRAARLDNIEQVIATGCSAVLQKTDLEALDAKIIVIADKTEIPKLIKTQVTLLPGLSHRSHPHLSTQDRIRVPVKVQDGCENYCSYCIVPHVRGKCYSVPADEIVNRVQCLAEAGTKEAVLTGINLGNYTDDNAGNLTALLKRLQTETDIYRVRLSSIEPPQVTSELIDFLALGNTLCEHLHIPLQSGSDKVLADMNRHYRAHDYRTLVASIREALPHTAITTDIIVGYPTETDKDFEATLRLAEEISFAQTHIFRYSPRVSTPAAELPQLEPAIVTARARILQEQADMDALRYQELRLGHSVEAIIETVATATGITTATTREYLRITLPVHNQSSGTLSTVTLTPDMLI